MSQRCRISELRGGIVKWKKLGQQAAVLKLHRPGTLRLTISCLFISPEVGEVLTPGFCSPGYFWGCWEVGVVFWRSGVAWGTRLHVGRLPPSRTKDPLRRLISPVLLYLPQLGLHRDLCNPDKLLCLGGCDSASFLSSKQSVGDAELRDAASPQKTLHPAETSDGPAAGRRGLPL